MIQPISPADVSALLSMIEPSWASRVPVVQAIASIEGGDWWSAPDVADLTGRTPGRARQQLAELAEARVILRDGGTGGRKFWCEVNPDWRRWDVPWRHPVRVVRQKLADIRERRSASALQRFIASPKHSRYAELTASLGTRDTAQKEAAEIALSRVLRARDNAIRPTPHRERRGSRSGGAVSRAHGTRDKSAPAQEEEYYSRGPERATDTPPPTDPPRAPTAADLKDFALARNAVYARSISGPRGKFLSGGPAEQLKVLIIYSGIDAVLVGIEKVEAGIHQPPRFVEHLADVVLGGGQELPLTVETAGQARLSLLEDLKRVQQMVGEYRLVEVEPPDDLLAEEAQLLAAIEDQP
jgi:hypothetical protein